MNVLIISPVVNKPVVAGNVARVNQICNFFLDYGCNVFFLYIPMGKNLSEDCKKQFGDNFFISKYKKRIKNFLVRKLRVFLGKYINEKFYNYTIDEWYDNSIDKLLKEVKRNNNFDIVCVEYVFLSKALLNFDEKTLKIIDAHDEFTNRYKKYLDAGIEPKWFSTSPSEEVIGINRADILLSIQKEETNRFRRKVNEFGEANKTRVIDFGYKPNLKKNLHRKGVFYLFFASDNVINIEAFSWFVINVYRPLISKGLGIKLKVAGSIAKYVKSEKKFIDLVYSDQVKFIEYIDDIEEIFEDVLLSINTVQIGTGINIKVLDSLANSVPVISTAKGCRGLEDYIGRGVFCPFSDDPEDFLDIIIDTMKFKREELMNISSLAYESAVDWCFKSEQELRRALLHYRD